MGWLPEKPRVFKERTYWVVELEHQTWVDRKDFGSWERAMEHALWIGLCAGVWVA